MDIREETIFFTEVLGSCQAESGEKGMRWGRGEQELESQRAGVTTIFNENKSG